MAKRRTLDRAAVVMRAAALADAAGSVQAVTLTTLAADLDIRVPSLYNHITSLEDLHDALAVYAAQQLMAALRGATMGTVGEEALVAWAVAYRDFAHAHPGIYPLTLRAPAPEDGALTDLAQELLQMLFLVLASLGIQGEAAIHVVRGLRALLHGFVTLEAAEGFKMAVDLDVSFLRMLRVYFAGVAAVEREEGEKGEGRLLAQRR